MSTRLALTLLLFVILSGCTQPTSGLITDPRNDPHFEEGLERSPPPEPQKQADPCEGVICPDSTTTCSNRTASCSNACISETGECTSCAPECPPCLESWSCSPWGPCADGLMTRTCTDTHICDTEQTKPAEQKTCTEEESEHILFSEIYYDTAGKDNKEEWIELYNPLTTIDLTGYTISDNKRTWSFPEGIKLEGHSYLVIARDNDGFFTLYNCSPHVSGLTLQLNNDGDILTLKNSEGSDEDSVAWENYVPGWSITAGNDRSTQRIPVERDTDTAAEWKEGEPDPAC